LDGDLDLIAPEASSNSKGIEITGLLYFVDVPVLRVLIDKLRLNYTFIDMDKEIQDNVSKFFNVRHKGSAMLQKNFFEHFTIACNIGYIDREGYYIRYNFEIDEYEKSKFTSYWLTDLRLSFQIKGFTLYTEATNLFDVEYIDVGKRGEANQATVKGFEE